MNADPEIPQALRITVDGAQTVPALLQGTHGALACLVLAHGAGAGMRHSFMEALAANLAARRVATLRYQFPYFESGSRRPDPPAVCHATVRAAAAEAVRRCPDVPLVAGGKSFGGRMTSQTQARAPMPGVRALAFFGFPLHPAGKPASERGRHLADVRLPMLFLQGTRDELAQWDLIGTVVGNLGDRATLHALQGADHAFHRRVKDGGGKGLDVTAELAEAFVAWLPSQTARVLET